MVTFTSISPNKALPNLPELDVTRVSASKHKGPTEPSVVSSIEYDRTAFEPAPRSPGQKHQPWRPLTQKPYFLMAVFSASLGLVVLLQVFLSRSERDGGIIFAANINSLPPGQTFCYLYLPTTVSLLLSFTWTWIDLDIKRLQPYWQLSRKGGARGNDSVLLHYPFDFVASVPLKAIRRQHWPVFSASFAVVAIFWGLTPLQSAIFAVKTVTRTHVQPAASSTTYLTIDEQSTLLTGSYTQSVYNIAWHNETLPPFMSRDAMLAPFGLVRTPNTVETAEEWTATTHMYSVDIACQPAIFNDTDAQSVTYDSNNGCRYPNSFLTPTEVLGSNQYLSNYVGYALETDIDSYLYESCPLSANQTFLLQWGRGTRNITPYELEFLESTTIYCESSYYQQYVNATVSRPGMSVINVVPLGPKQPLPEDLFNITEFEHSMSAHTEVFRNRGNYPPIVDWPDATEKVQYLNLSRRYNYLPSLTGFAIAAHQRPAPAYMDASLLQDSYQAAYRLLFARRLSDILSSDLEPSDHHVAARTYHTQAVVLVRTFVYVVEGLLCVTALVACILLLLSYITANNLKSDPANIGSLMAIAADDTTLCQKIGIFDQSNSKDLDKAFAKATFGLLEETKLNSGQGYGLKIFGHSSETGPLQRAIPPAKGILPKELSWLSGVVFFATQVSIVFVLTYAFIYSQRHDGMSLPSSSTLINQIVENYIPMAIAAFFEPVWVVLNRMICMLQPYEQLRKGSAPAVKSLTIDYSSLPPQAVIWRALRAGHISLALICMMVILANVLSIAFNSIVFESNVDSAVSATFDQPYAFPMNGSSIGNASFANLKPDYDPFYVMGSNLTAGTPLPGWTDESFFYLPFEHQTLLNVTMRGATTYAVKASLSCVPLATTGNNSLKHTFSDGAETWGVNVITINATTTFSEPATTCHTRLNSSIMSSTTEDKVAMEIFMFEDTLRNTTCDNLIIAGWLRVTNVSMIEAEKDHPDILEETWIACMPDIHVSTREVTVDLNNIVQTSKAQSDAVDNSETMFWPSRSDLISSVHKVLGQSIYPLGATWHSDSYPSDWLTYLMTTARNRSDFLDLGLPPPSSDQTVAAFSALYSNLFAITLGTNLEKILQPTSDTTVNGLFIVSETRLFVSRSMFVVSVMILSTYLITTAAIYITRPWKILPRMPTSIASQVAFFAASHTLEDLKGTGAMTLQGRNWYIDSLQGKYGFGRYLGTDGKAHLGIEREPLVQTLKKHDLRIERK